MTFEEWMEPFIDWGEAWESNATNTIQLSLNLLESAPTTHASGAGDTVEERGHTGWIAPIYSGDGTRPRDMT